MRQAKGNSHIQSKSTVGSRVFHFSFGIGKGGV